MKKYIAVVASDKGKVTKYQDFDTQTEADLHVAEHGGFVAPSPGENYLFFVVQNSTLVYDTAAEDGAKIFSNDQVQADRAEMYLPIADQLDMQYWDKVNGTTLWLDHVAYVKKAIKKP